MAKRRGRGREIVLPGDYLLVTVRVLLRRYLLKPDRNMKAASRWILGHYAKKHGVRILALCFMSTHLCIPPTLGCPRTGGDLELGTHWPGHVRDRVVAGAQVAFGRA